jgi:hypothetical protein
MIVFYGAETLALRKVVYKYLEGFKCGVEGELRRSVRPAM